MLLGSSLLRRFTHAQKSSSFRYAMAGKVMKAMKAMKAKAKKAAEAPAPKAMKAMKAMKK